jgi:predicted ester cyclase
VTEQVNTIREAVAAMNRGDIDGYLHHFEPSCLRWMAGLDDPVPLAVIEDGMRQLDAAFDPLVLVEEALFGEGPLVCARWCLTGTHVRDFMGIPASGTEIAAPTCEVYEVREGRVVEVWTYGNPIAVLEQIGVEGQGDGTRD